MTAVSMFQYDSQSPRGPQLLRALFVVLSHSRGAHRIWLQLAFPDSAQPDAGTPTFVLDPAKAKKELIDPLTDVTYLRFGLIGPRHIGRQTPDVAVVRYQRQAVFVQSYLSVDDAPTPPVGKHKRGSAQPSHQIAAPTLRVSWSDLITALAGFHNAASPRRDPYVAEFLIYCKQHYPDVWSGGIAPEANADIPPSAGAVSNAGPARWTRPWIQAQWARHRPTPVEVPVIAASLTLLLLPDRLGRPISFGLSMVAGLLGIINGVRWRLRARRASTQQPSRARPAFEGRRDVGFVIPTFIATLTTLVLVRAFHTDASSTSTLNIAVLFAAICCAGLLAQSALRWHWKNRVLVELSLAESAVAARWPMAFWQARLRDAAHASAMATSRTTTAFATVVATTAVVFHPKPPPPDLTGTWAISTLTPDHDKPMGGVHDPNAPQPSTAWVITQQSSCSSNCLYYVSDAGTTLMVLRPQTTKAWTGLREVSTDCIEPLPSNTVLQPSAYADTYVYTFTLTSPHHATVTLDLFGNTSSAAQAKGCSPTSYGTYEGTGTR